MPLVSRPQWPVLDFDALAPAVALLALCAAGAQYLRTCTSR